jgi:osmotically inducible protein OsmC
MGGLQACCWPSNIAFRGNRASREKAFEAVAEGGAVSFRITRSASVSWLGAYPDGGGRIALGSGAYEGPFSLRARAEDVQNATNPEELIGAAAAGCYTMSLANMLSERGHPPDVLETTAKVRLEQTDAGFSVTLIALTTTGRVPGLDQESFSSLAEEAKATCTISRALAGTTVTVQATLAA